MADETTEQEVKPRLTKEEMIEQGLIPAPKVKQVETPIANPEMVEAAGSLGENIAKVAEIPVGDLEEAELISDDVQTQVRQAQRRAARRPEPANSNVVDQQKLFDKASQRGQMALDVVKAVVSHAGIKIPPSELVDYAFAVADQIHIEVDNGYNTDLARHASTLS